MIIAVLPLRLESSRISKKVLADIKGKSLSVRTVERALKAFEKSPNIVVVAAVDNEKVAEHLKKYFPKLRVELTDPGLPSGTDRVFAAVGQMIKENSGLKSKIKGIINIQGDMPFLSAGGLDQVAQYFLNRDSKLDQNFMLTLAQSWPKDQKYDDIGAVKVISDKNGRAIYFSRFPIPYSRLTWKKSKELIGDLHIGVYGYTLESLASFCATASTDFERSESLEQLRALWLGIPIYVLNTEPEKGSSYRGIDTPKDLLWAKKWAQNGAKKVKK